jgi:segregation and condensation protein B
MNSSLTQKIIALLFFSGDTFTVAQLSKVIGDSEENILQAMNNILAQLQPLGLSLNTLDNTYSLTTHSEVADFINNIRKQELQSSLSPAAIETLALILYRQPIRKVDIDYVRGVNSQFILRNLYTKGLITREKDLLDERSHVYKATLALLEFLGVDSIDQLPEYEVLREELLAKEEVLHQETDAQK